MKWSDSKAVIQQSGHKINRIMKLRFRIGATAQFLLAFGHLICMLDLWRIFEVYGIAEPMQGLAAISAPLPYLITIGLVVCVTLAGLYALAYCGDIRPLPLTRIAVWVICLLFLGRGLIGKVILDFNLLSLSSALIATLIGLCYLPVPCNKR